jgi:hypothetical protein
MSDTLAAFRPALLAADNRLARPIRVVGPAVTMTSSMRTRLVAHEKRTKTPTTFVTVGN